MLRERLKDALAQAEQQGNSEELAVLRLIRTAIKDRDAAAHVRGRDAIDDTEIHDMLRTMLRQRDESIGAYEQSGRIELVEQEQLEQRVIRRFLPPQMSEDEIEAAVRATIAACCAKGLKDLGRTVDALKSAYGPEMDLGCASSAAKRLLRNCQPG
ncbi:GatB/YqeY domain-containing protein [Tistrella mobilis]|uniref:GatB/Yqey domain superfamily n=1 Tax=Tistrella mobilis (strain KA081020-065) TaxID=1110502 RepID=I3TVD0_TISMK|nr:GatB/YqeY domain-containing protein [Tistrella mobilis]AFK56718.1 GatB/Yqey domain superfamily [Tistrella mobilis KA081020-065]MAM75453.1 GatB/Yqey domain superfamily [Tistrella sp.]